jgi:tRNA (Thr-GGU) A37 N-methylase
MRKKDRPNLLGLTMVKLVKKEGRTLFVEGLDAIDGTPVLDIKPVFREFLPSGEVVQPEWVSVMLKDYYAK